MLKESRLIIVNFFNQINSFIFSLGKPTSLITGLIFILSGILLLFWGNRLKRVSLTLLGFTLGVIVGFYFSFLIVKESFILILIVILVFGLSFSLLVNFLYKIIFIIIGAFLGYIFSFILISYFEVSQLLKIAIISLGMMLFAFLSIKIEKIMFIIITCYYGYLIFRLGIYSLNIKIENFIREIVCYIFLFGGVFFQFYEEIMQKRYISIEKSRTDVEKND